MQNIPLGFSSYFRGVAKEARIRLRNRYYETNPVLTETGGALISRPGMKRWAYAGEGPIRGVYSQPGTFDGDLFVVSGSEWYRVNQMGTATLILSGVRGGLGAVSMAGAGNIGETPELMFMSDGTTLYVYVEDGYAQGTISGSPADNDVIRIDTMYYRFTIGSVDAGTPAGTLANPWLIALEGSAALTWANFAAAVAGDGDAGVQYSTALTPNTVVEVTNVDTGLVSVRSVNRGVAGNSIITTETGAGISWSQGGTLAGGGSPSVSQVRTPMDVGIISLGYVSSHVVCIPAQGEGINGRFYWIEPGEVVIDPLNFATAERSPDPIFSVVVFGDQFWLPGSSTTEVWFFTGNQDSPVQRLQGVTFDRGTWEGTAVQVKDSMIMVDADGGVFRISGGIERISPPDVEERIRKAIQRLALVTGA